MPGCWGGERGESSGGVKGKPKGRAKGEAVCEVWLHGKHTPGLETLP